MSNHPVHTLDGLSTAKKICEEILAQGETPRFYLAQQMPLPRPVREKMSYEDQAKQEPNR